MTNNRVLKLYRKLLRLPLGKQIFSSIAARKAPYFTSISPQVEQLVENRCVVLVKKRKAVENHIGTVHVIAIANGLEMAMGFMAEASIPTTLRWIPKGMTLDYVSKGKSDIRCIASVNADQWQAGDLAVPVLAIDTAGETVVSGEIKLWITQKSTTPL